MTLEIVLSRVISSKFIKLFYKYPTPQLIL